MGSSRATAERHPGVRDRLAERLEGRLKRAVPEAAVILREAMPVSANRAEDAAVSSLNANFMSMIGDLRRGTPTEEPQLPADAVHWPRELAHNGSPQDCIIRGYLVCGEYWWRTAVLPEVLEISRDTLSPGDAFDLAQLSSEVVFDYIRDMALQASGEYRLSQGLPPDCEGQMVSAARGGRPGALPTVGPSAEASSILDLLLSTSDLDGTEALVEARLARFDPARDDHAELLRTALQWFDSLCCNVTSARRLGVHRNTLLYRLRKIEQFLGHSLQKDRFELELAIRIAERLPRERREPDAEQAPLV